MARTKQLARLKEILSVPTYFKQEHGLLRYLITYLKTTPYKFSVDAFGNLYITKGYAAYYPCVCAHTDSVFPLSEYAIEEVTRENKCALIGKDREGNQCGMGADDKAGVFVCMELLDQMPVIKVALFAGEEFGCVGSRNASPAFFWDVAYALEFDCPGKSNVTYECSGLQLFDPAGDFYHQVKPILTKYMERNPVLRRHPFTDVWSLRHLFSFSCINIATGYYNYHQPTEYVMVDEVFAAIAMGKDIIGALGPEKQIFWPGITDFPDYDEIVEMMREFYPDAFLPPSGYAEFLALADNQIQIILLPHKKVRLILN